MALSNGTTTTRIQWSLKWFTNYNRIESYIVETNSPKVERGNDRIRESQVDKRKEAEIGDQANTCRYNSLPRDVELRAYYSCEAKYKVP